MWEGLFLRKTASGTYVSSFTNADGKPLTIDQNHAVFTICSRNDVKTGGHAYCYLEHMEHGAFRMIRYDLSTPGWGKISLSSDCIQTLTDDRIVTNNIKKELRYYNTTKHHSYQISKGQAKAVMYSFKKFKKKNDNKRYVYSLVGGNIGRVMHYLRGKRGVNCADMTLKLLRDANIAVVHDRWINTPRFAAGSSNRKASDLSGSMDNFYV